jgi:hypothetical protein
MIHLLYLEEGSAQSLTFRAEKKGADMEARQEARLKEHLGSRPESTGRKYRFAEPTGGIMAGADRNVQAKCQHASKYLWAHYSHARIEAGDIRPNCDDSRWTWYVGQDFFTQTNA